MKNPLGKVALAALAIAPALAAAAGSYPMMYPPGPSIWAFLAFCFGG